MAIEYINKTEGTDKDYYLMIVDRNGLIHFANSYLISNLGLTHYETPGYNFFQLLDSDQLKNFKYTLSAVHTKDCPAEVEISARNGSLHWIKWEVSKYKAEADGNDKFFCVGFDIAGKTKVKKMQQVAKNNYEAIMEGLTIGVIMQDKNGEVLAANKRAAQILGTSFESIYDINEFKKLWKTFKNENDEISFENSPPIKAIQTGAVQCNVQITFKDRAGEIKSIVINSQPLFENNSSAPASVVTSIIDVTRENKLEKVLHQQEILFHTFQNNSPHLSWMVNEDARLLYANASFFKYLGLDETVIGKNILDIVPKVIADALENKHREVVKTNLPKQVQEKMFLADGSMIVFWINLFPVQLMNGKKMIGGEAINITERFLAEEGLQRVNERLKYLSHITTDAIWEWDMRSGHILRNQVLKDITGFTNSNTQSLTWWLRRVHEEDRKRLYSTIKNVIEKREQSWESEYRFKKASGEYMMVLDRGYVIYENDTPVKMIGSLHDITQLKELEGKLLREKIQHQKTITETIFAVQEKERTRIGHELHDNVNQILSSCKLYMEMIRPATNNDEHLKVKITKYIHTAIEEIRKLSREMVSPQLKENGLIPSIATLVDDLVTTHAMNVTFHHQEEAEGLTSGKKVALFRIVQEQVKNTLKYSNAKNLVIDLHADDKYVTLIIEDDGIGFDPRKTSRGIGLSNIYERTKFYDGDVSIKTSPGQGCKIIVKIPFDN